MPWRDASDDDRPHLERMIRALYDEDPSMVPMTPAKIARTLTTLSRQPERGRAVVLDMRAEHPHEKTGSAPAGYALLCSFWSNELGGEVCIIDELYVERSARKRGHASALVRELVAGTAPWFRDAVAVELEVTPSNAQARALYERLGFVPYKNALMRKTR